MGATLNYFSLLGIGEDAGQDEIEARYQALSEYLASATIPPSLREWAHKQAKLVDEAYAVLSDPDQRAAAKGGKASAAAKPQPAPAETQPSAAAVAAGGRRAGVAALEAAGPDQKAGTSAPLTSALRGRSLAIGAIAGLVVLAVVLVARSGLSGGGDGNNGAAATPDQSGFIPLDTARVAELMQSAQTDPTNTETLFELGESFFQAGEWQSTIDWFTKLVALDPSNVHALTDIGTSEYNLGKVEEAKATWLKVNEIAPNDPQVHYNLGFLYANSEPQDLDAAREEWALVIQLAPDSDLAQTVKLHLDGLAGGEATPQATATPP